VGGKRNLNLRGTEIQKKGEEEAKKPVKKKRTE